MEIRTSAIDSTRFVEVERNWMMVAAIPFVVLGVFMGGWAIAEGDD